MKDKNTTLKRKVKEVNGVKVNHPHSAANIWYAIMTLFLVAIPVGMLFIPLIITPSGIQVTGLEFAKSLFMGFKVEDDALGGLFKFLNEYVPANIGQYGDIVKYIVMGQACLWGLLVLFGIISFILFIVNLSKGYLVKSKGPKSMAGLMFGFGLLYAISFVVYYLLEMICNQASQLFVWWSFAVPVAGLLFLIIIGCIYSSNFRDSVLERDLEYHEDPDGNVVTHVTEVHKVTKYKYEQASTLPSNLTSIGGHAYSQNQALQIANIPLGIKSLGAGAFSNCLKLRMVTIPKSVKEIGANCFFNCPSLERVNYAGTKQEWRKVARGSNWLTKAKTSKVVCTDGVLVVNPYN